MAVSEYAWFNGGIVTSGKADPSVASNTLHLGIAVFDGIMAYWNDDHWYVHRGDAHLRRFCTGAGRMDLVTPYRAADLGAGIGELLETLPRRTHYLRPIAYRTAPDPFFIVTEDSPSMCVFAVPVRRDEDEPYRCELSPIQRIHHKAVPATWKVSGAYANSYLAERHAKTAGFDTGLMLDQRGRVAEASSSNVFFVAGDTLVTPRLDGDVFPGITRDVLRECAARDGIPVQERDIWPPELPTFDAVLVCGTLSEVHAVDQIGDLHYRSSTHPLVRRLIGAFRTVTHQ
jgi:branched-chain amino acid aminotransferase